MLMKSVFARGFGGGDDGPRVELVGANNKRLIKWGLIALAALVVGIFLFNHIVNVTRIEAGYEGVEINLAGSQRGAADIPIRTGWVFYSPLKTQIIEFPTFVQTVKWT